MPKAPNRTRKALNVTLPPALRKFAKAYFPKTGFKNVSGFMEAKLKQHARSEAKKIRKAGVAIPPEVFDK